MFDTKKSLDYQKNFFQLIEDILLSHIRYTKKEIEREIKLIFLQLRKILSICSTKDEFKQKVEPLSEKIKNLKNKLNKLEQEEKKILSELKLRFTKTLTAFNKNTASNNFFLKLKEYNEYQNDVLLGEYFLDKGLLETFLCFQKENNIIIYKYNYYFEKKILMNYINEEKTKKILEWANFYKKKIIQNEPDTFFEILTNLFHIYKNEQINDIDCNVNCVNFIRKYFNIFINIKREEITKLIMSLIISNNNKNEDNKKLLNNIKEIVNEKYEKFFGFGNYSLFELLLTLGITTLKTRFCDKNTYNFIFFRKNNDCPICGKDGHNMTKMKNKVYNYVHNRSYLFCSIDDKVTNTSNPPMINKEGKIICKNCLNKNKISEEKYVDPKTKKEYNVSDWKLIYLS
jgi:uncharacterized Zn finger protein (UPF0148 family)